MSSRRARHSLTPPAPAPPDTPRSEDDPLYLEAPGPFAGSVRAIRDLEQTTLGTPGVTGAVLRYGYLYGPDTHYAADGSIATDVRRRRFPVVGSGTGVFSFVHIADAARATLAAIDTGAEGIYNITDDEPAPVAEWLPFYARLLGAPPPTADTHLAGQDIRRPLRRLPHDRDARRLQHPRQGITRLETRETQQAGGDGATS